MPNVYVSILILSSSILLLFSKTQSRFRVSSMSPSEHIAFIEKLFRIPFGHEDLMFSRWILKRRLPLFFVCFSKKIFLFFHSLFTRRQSLSSSKTHNRQIAPELVQCVMHKHQKSYMIVYYHHHHKTDSYLNWNKNSNCIATERQVKSDQTIPKLP